MLIFQIRFQETEKPSGLSQTIPTPIIEPWMNDIIKQRESEIPPDIKKKMQENTIVYAAVAHILKNTQGDATWRAFRSFSSLLSNPNFNEKAFETALYIAKNIQGDATYYAFSYFSFLLSNPNFQEDWITPQSLVYLINTLIQTVNAIISNTQGDATWRVFRSFSSLLSNPNFTEDWINPQSEQYLIDNLIQTTNAITSNTQGDATRYAFSSFSFLLSNPNFQEDWINPQSLVYLINTLIQTVNAIISNTKGDATWEEFSSFSFLLSNPNFNESWIDRYWNPIFTAIISNTQGDATWRAFRSFSSLLSNPDENNAFLKYTRNDITITQLLFHLSTMFAIELGRPLDDLHDNTPERMKYLSSLTTVQVFSFLCSKPEYFYTSTNDHLFDRLKKDLKGKTVEEYLKEIAGVSFDSELGRNFLFRAINYDRLFGRGNSLLKKEEINSAAKALITPISNTVFDAQYYSLLANGINSAIKSEVLNKEKLQGIITERLTAIPESEKQIQRALEYSLYLLNPETTLLSNSQKQEIANLQKQTKFNPNSYLNSDGFITAVQVFDREDMQRDDHWSLTKDRFKKEYGAPKKASENEFIYEKGGRRIIIYMGENEQENQSFIKEKLSEYQNLVFTFRGHSYSLNDNFPANIFSNSTGNILFIPGSCGSAGSTADYLMANPNTNLNFISYTSTGRGEVTNIILSSLLNYSAPVEFAAAIADSAKTIESYETPISTIRFSSSGEQLIKYVLAGKQ